jgi:hypothetical protein
MAGAEVAIIPFKKQKTLKTLSSGDYDFSFA